MKFHCLIGGCRRFHDPVISLYVSLSFLSSLSLCRFSLPFLSSLSRPSLVFLSSLSHPSLSLPPLFRCISLSLSPCLSFTIPLSVSLFLSVNIPLSLSPSVFLSLSVSPYLCLSVYLSVYLSVCLSLSLSVSVSLTHTHSLSLVFLSLSLFSPASLLSVSLTARIEPTPLSDIQVEYINSIPGIAWRVSLLFNTSQDSFDRSK